MNSSRLKSVTQLFRLRVLWKFILFLLLVASCTYLIFGTPARLKQRLVGWQPEFGTLNGLDYMRQGSYTWLPKGRYKGLPEVQIELRYDWEAIQWLLENVRGNVVIAEAAEADYYQAGGTRIATMTGLSGLNGSHEREQRYGTMVAERDALHLEFWQTPDITRTSQLIEELGVALIYVGQIESHIHSQARAKLEQMHRTGILTVIYQNEKTTIYAVPTRVLQAEDGKYYPLPLTQ